MGVHTFKNSLQDGSLEFGGSKCKIHWIQGKKPPRERKTIKPHGKALSFFPREGKSSFYGAIDKRQETKNLYI